MSCKPCRTCGTCRGRNRGECELPDKWTSRWLEGRVPLRDCQNPGEIPRANPAPNTFDALAEGVGASLLVRLV